MLREARLLPADLDRVFFAERFVRVLDRSGYATWRRWRVYGEEGLAGREAALWLREKTLTVEIGGETLSRYAVELAAGTGRPQAVARPVLFGTAIPPTQPKLFALSILGEGGWLAARVAAAGPVPLPRGMGLTHGTFAGPPPPVAPYSGPAREARVL